MMQHALRIYIYSQLFAVALIGLTAHWDRVGTPTGASQILFGLSILFIYLIPVVPIALLAILWFSKFDERQKLYLGIVGGFAWVAQVIAATPTFQ
jgi:hypothetical protein